MGFDPLEYILFEEITRDDDDDWRDEFQFNDYNLDPDDYDSKEEFLEAVEEARVNAEITKEEEENEWRDEHMFNKYNLDPDDYDSEEDFLEALEEAEADALIVIEEDTDEENSDWDNDDNDENW